KAESLCVTVNGCAPRRMMEPAGAHGSANSVYAHLTSREAGMSVFMSAAMNVPLLWPTAPVVGVPKPPPSAEQRKDTSLPDGHVAPHVESSSRPRTNLVVPSSPVMSGRARVRAYHSLSTRDASRSLSDMFLLHDVTLSINPLIVTFGVGPAGVVCCAPAYGAKSTRMTKTEATTARNLLMTASSMWKVKQLQRSTGTTGPTPTPTHTRNRGHVLPRSTQGVKENGYPDRGLATLSESPEPFACCLAEGRLRGEILDSAERSLGLIAPVLRREHEPQAVVGRFLRGVQAAREGERLLGLPITLQVEEGHPHVLIRRFWRRDGPHRDRFSGGGDGFFPSPELGKCHTDILLRQAEGRVELKRPGERRK